MTHQNALKNLFAEILQEMLEAKMDTHLGYGKHDVQNKQTNNSRNGRSKKTITSDYGLLPKTEIQKCIIHQIRNSTRYVSYSDLKKVTADLKPIYKAATEEMTLVELDRFEEAWGSMYPLIIRSWRSNWSELATFFKYPPEIHKLIYATNMIEGYHRQLRKMTKGKSIFSTDEALLKMLYLVTMDVTRI